MPIGKILAIVNQKGGVGKTTTSINLAAALGRLGHQCLLIDFDPQCNATSSLGFPVGSEHKSIYDVICGLASLEDAVASTKSDNVYIVPSHPDLAGAEVEMAILEERELILRNSLSLDDLDMDFAFIDCPPSLSLLTINALVAAHGVLVPVQCEYLALEGLMRLMQTVDAVRLSLHPTMYVVGILMTMYDVRTNLSGEVVQEVKRHFPGLVFREAIPRSVRLSEAPSRGLDIFRYAPNSSGALAHKTVAEELLLRLGTSNN